MTPLCLSTEICEFMVQKQILHSFWKFNLLSSLKHRRASVAEEKSEDTKEEVCNYGLK